MLVKATYVASKKCWRLKPMKRGAQPLYRTATKIVLCRFVVDSKKREQYLYTRKGVNHWHLEGDHIAGSAYTLDEIKQRFPEVVYKPHEADCLQLKASGALIAGAHTMYLIEDKIYASGLVYV